MVDSLSEEEVALLRELSDRERYGEHVNPRPAIILTRADLERGYFARHDLLEHSHGGRLADIAQASDRIYLRAAE